MNEKKQKSVEELRQEYTNLCAKAGHIQYQIKVLKDDLDLVYKTLRDLNLEAAAASASESAKIEGEASSGA